MSLNSRGIRNLAFGAMYLVLSVWHDSGRALSMERVRLESVTHSESTFIDGYMAKPDGTGPFPAVVLLHGCNGLPADLKAGGGNPWVDRFVDWGYVALVVDSFSSRGVEEACITPLALDRVADAYGGAAFLSRQQFVDTNRIAVLGFSAGGNAALSAVEQPNFDSYGEQNHAKFKAAIAYYPYCLHDGHFAASTLILIGELDDWTPASACRQMMATRKNIGSPVALVTYPDAYHGFDMALLQPGRHYFGHWVEYNQTAAENALQKVQHFLSENLAN
jgi:dienelactone hydrolase